MHRRLLWLDILAAIVIVVGVAGAALFLTRQPSSAKPTPFPTASVSVTPSPTPSVTSVDYGDWPTYGYDNARTRFAPEIALRPPFRTKWQWHPGDLLEFPPSIWQNRLYVATEHGFIYCLRAPDRSTKWRHKVSGQIASTPTIAKGKVYVTTFEHGLLVYDGLTGRKLWSFASGSTESSPLVWDGMVYFGDRAGRVFAVNTRTHKQEWSYQTGGKVAGAPAMLNGRIVVGSYDGAVYCFSPGGHLYWRRSTGSSLSSDSFYATATLAYNTVYIGSISDRIYALDLSNGGTRWSFGTGGWIYSSPAVWHGIVYEGSYDGRFYALSASSGQLRWSFSAGGQISGSPTVIDGVVYFSTTSHRTWGLNARTGKVVWGMNDGSYTPVTGDTAHLYFCGTHTLYCLMAKKK